MALLGRVIGSILLVTACVFSPNLMAAERPCALGPVAYAGDVPDYFRAEIEQALAYALEASQGVALELRVGSCQQIDCLLEPAAAVAAAAVILAQIRTHDRNYVIELVAHAVADGEVLAQVSAECSVCGQQELLDMLPAEVARLRAKVLQALADRPLPQRLPAVGDPVVSPPVEPVQPVRSVGVGPRIGGWLAVVLGVGGSGTGAALLALDGRDHAPTCMSEVVDVNGACPNIYNTATAGAIVLVLGLADLGVGIGLVVHHRRFARTTQVERTLRAQLAPGGVQLRF